MQEAASGSLQGTIAEVRRHNNLHMSRIRDRNNSYTYANRTDQEGAELTGCGGKPEGTDQGDMPTSESSRRVVKQDKKASDDIDYGQCNQGIRIVIV